MKLDEIPYSVAAARSRFTPLAPGFLDPLKSMFSRGNVGDWVCPFYVGNPPSFKPILCR